MSHQDRRDPLPAEYQFPTHGVDCDCPTCRWRVTFDPKFYFSIYYSKDVVVEGWSGTGTDRTQTAYGWGV